MIALQVFHKVADKYDVMNDLMSGGLHRSLLCITRSTHVTHHTSHVTHHTSHVTRHTSRDARKQLGVLVVASDCLVGIDGERLPHDNFANVCGDEEGDAAAEAVALGGGWM